MTIGLVLRGAQGEYGFENCLAESAEAMITAAARTLASQHGGHIVAIENHLRRSGLNPDAIEAQYRRCDLILTTRFHGAMLALRNHVPFVAIDQIHGGAKVAGLLGGSGWPHVYMADAITTDDLTRDAAQALEGARGRLAQVRVAVRARAERTLVELGERLD